MDGLDPSKIAEIIKNEVNNALKESAQKTFYRGIVSAVSENTADIKIEGSTTAIPNVICIGSYQPVVNDVVMVISIGLTGANFLCIGRIDNTSRPIGDIIMSFRATPKAGNLFMAGGTYNKADYPLLWALNTSHPAYFATSDTNTFTLKDMRQRVPVGKYTSGTFATLGATGGSETNTHTHWTGTSNDGNSQYQTSSTVITGAGGRSRVITASRSSISAASGSAATREDSTYPETINIVQPYIVLQYEIIAK